LAPITPFISEEIYQSLKGTNFAKKNSVHLEEWPRFDKKKIDDSLEEEMVTVREIVSKGLDERIQVKIPVKQPLAKITITANKEIRDELKEPIMDELNIKKVELKKGSELSVKLDIKMTPELEQEGAAREIMRKVNDMRKKAKLTIQDRIEIFIQTDSELISNSVKKFKEEIMKSVQADSITEKANNGNELIIKEQKVKIEIKKK